MYYTNYKRVFAFGCSFTSYTWPMWADIIASECTNARFYNFGRSGAGNLNIACRISEANNIFNFQQDDLILVLWTSFTREDRWIDHKWLTVGNVFNSKFYDEAFVKKYCDPLGYLIRDLALITATHTLLDRLPCHSIKLFSYDARTDLNEGFVPEINKSKSEVSKFFNTYGSFIEGNITNTLDKFMYNDLLRTRCGYNYVGLNSTVPEYDVHPTPKYMHTWLKTHNLNLTNKSYEFAKEQQDILIGCKTHNEICLAFKDNGKRIDESYQILL